jgi:hypothetical protein
LDFFNLTNKRWLERKRRGERPVDRKVEHDRLAEVALG